MLPDRSSTVLVPKQVPAPIAIIHQLSAERELLLNTPAVASVNRRRQDVAAPARHPGRPQTSDGPLNDALARFVQSGAVDLREAFQRSPDRPGFLATIHRQGSDTSSIERFA